jgi:diacylglycerol kinase
MKSIAKFVCNEINKIGNALRGMKLFFAWGGTHFKLQILILIVTISVGLSLKFTTERMVILLIMSVVIILIELINSAFEKTIDYISNKKFDERARDIKDFMAGVVATTFIIHICVFVIFIIWRTN